MLGSVETAVKMYKYLFLNLNFIPSVVSHPIIVHLGEQKMRLNADSGVLYATSNIEHLASIMPFEYGSIHLLILNNACVFVVVVFLCLKIDDLLFYLPSIVGTSFALIIQTHARCDVLERAIDAEKEESQSIDQEMSTKSRITLSNCNALLILSEISAKLDRFDPLTIRRLPFSCITFSPNKWWISHKRRLFIPVKFLQKHFFFLQMKSVGFIFLSNQMMNLFYLAGLVANWSTSWSGFALKIPMKLPSNGMLSMITWISVTAMAIPISQYNGYSSIDW